MVKAGKKLYVLVNEDSTESWLTREDAREAKKEGDLYLEVPLSTKQRSKLQSIIDNIITSAVSPQIDNIIQEGIINHV